MTKPHYGATPGDWELFDTLLGLTKDLLPVVSNPNAKVAPNSKLRDIGKVPSVYNQQGQVVGLARWTERQATDLDIAKWEKHDDYGLCIQTRDARSIDVDVADWLASHAIRESIERYLGFKLPCRSRPNSGKLLLFVRVAGEIPKSTVKVDGGIIERLGTGQQFVVSGTHPSGARYELEWPEGNITIPVLSPERWDELWAHIVKEFGVAAPVVGSARRRAATDSGSDELRGITDDVAAHLITHNHVIGEGRDGSLYVECPWKDGHSSDSGETETAYLPAGTNTYEQGHFKCLHASCAHRTDEEFKTAFGCGVIDDFEDLPPLLTQTRSGTGVDMVPVSLPDFPRKKDGSIETTLGNLLSACRRPEVCRWRIAHDVFTDNLVFAPDGTDEWCEFTDAHYVELREWLERIGFESVGREVMRDVVLRVSFENKIDTAKIWASMLKWDGVARIEMYLTRYMGVLDSPYTRAVSRYIWTALAGRAIQPGVKADMVPILIGEQGLMKSSAVQAMAPYADCFTEAKLDDRDDNLSRQLRGKLVVELPELTGLHTRELESIKAWITKTFENWVPKYREFATKFWRRCLFIGTTNMHEFLADKTGNRRWLPVVCLRILIEDIKRDRDQLWAEGIEQFELMGIDWSAEGLAREVHESHMMSDAWEELIAPWLERPDTSDIRDTEGATRQFVQVQDVLTNCMDMTKSQINKGHEMRVSAILRKLGWCKGRDFVGGKQIRAWVRKTSTT